MTMLVNLNIVSERLSANASIGRRFASGSIASATPNSSENTTTWSTCPSAIDLAMFSGKMCWMISEGVSGFASSFSWAGTGGSLIPLPACEMLIAASPMKSAIVVTISK